MTAEVWPWYAWSATTKWSPPVCARASRIARSLASLPELTKKQTESGAGMVAVSLAAS